MKKFIKFKDSQDLDVIIETTNLLIRQVKYTENGVNFYEVHILNKTFGCTFTYVKKEEMYHKFNYFGKKLGLNKNI